ncbi:MAG: hypothetical protein C5B48_00535 [Candidatus Rokuibacteriota bacterium]|nr:MAG: hypothetical protein C5B48_00535 [Candidatus Rokubacteria bacterium]
MWQLVLALLLSGWLLVPAVSAEVLYGADGAGGHSSSLFTLDPASGKVLSTVGAIGFAVTGLAIHPTTGAMFGSTARMGANAKSLITIDKANGHGTLVAALSFPADQDQTQTLSDLTFTSDGTLYGLGSNDGQLYTIDQATAHATAVGTPENIGKPSGGAIAADGCNTIYLSGTTDSGILQTIDRTTGEPSEGIPLSGNTDNPLSAMKFNSAGDLIAALLDNSEDTPTASLIKVDKRTGNIVTLGPTVDRLDAIAFDGVTFAPCAFLVAAILPASRSVQVAQPATAFVSVINSGSTTANDVGIFPNNALPLNLLFQPTDPATNKPTGGPNQTVSIAPGQAQTYVIAVTPTDLLGPTDVSFNFAGTNTAPVTTLTGLNTLLLSASAEPVPDIVALAATVQNDGIVHIPGNTATGFFSVATINVGAAGDITASADTGGATLPVAIALCQTNTTGGCMSPPAPTVQTSIGANGTPTFAVFVAGQDFVPFDPAKNRVFVRFTGADDTVRGATSVAVRTQ